MFFQRVPYKLSTNCRIANLQVPFHSFQEPRKIVAALVQRDLESKIKRYHVSQGDNAERDIRKEENIEILKPKEIQPTKKNTVTAFKNPRR